MQAEDTRALISELYLLSNIILFPPTIKSLIEKSLLHDLISLKKNTTVNSQCPAEPWSKMVLLYKTEPAVPCSYSVLKVEIKHHTPNIQKRHPIFVQRQKMHTLSGKISSVKKTSLVNFILETKV